MPHRKKILLSDSNEAFSMLLADSLRERGDFRVFHARDTDETTKALHRHRPHVLLLDFLLPHKGGFHVMQHLREDGYKISTIFMTALPTHRVIEEAYRLGASFVLPKPFTTRGNRQSRQRLDRHGTIVVGSCETFHHYNVQGVK